MKVKEKAASFNELWLHVNAGDEGMQVRYFAKSIVPDIRIMRAKKQNSHGLTGLENETLVAGAAGDLFAVEVFQ
jgi:hypothetical protein